VTRVRCCGPSWPPTPPRARRSRPFSAGGLERVEVEYVRTSGILDGSKQECALAVSTSEGPVVLHLGGLDTEEHQRMLPAHELAGKTLRTA
jgi:hypothetical protein